MGKIAAFIDDVIVAMEDEKGYDELVAEIVKRLEENDLYVKLEKCKWKVREVGFLGIVIGPEEIKIEEEKVKGILDWPILKCVKDIQKFLGLANYYHWFIQGFVSIARPLLSGAVYTGVEVCRMDSELSRLVERPWLQLMCCTVCLLHGCNFR